MDQEPVFWASSWHFVTLMDEPNDALLLGQLENDPEPSRKYHCHILRFHIEDPHLDTVKSCGSFKLDSVILQVHSIGDQELLIITKDEIGFWVRLQVWCYSWPVDSQVSPTLTRMDDSVLEDARSDSIFFGFFTTNNPARSGHGQIRFSHFRMDVEMETVYHYDIEGRYWTKEFTDIENTGSDMEIMIGEGSKELMIFNNAEELTQLWQR